MERRMHDLRMLHNRLSKQHIIAYGVAVFSRQKHLGQINSGPTEC
jgi:hypothetical protein